MTSDVDPFGIAAIVPDILIRPGKGPGHILDVFGVANAGRQAIIGEHNDQAPFGQATCDGTVAVEAEVIILAADDPAAPVEEEEHGTRLLLPGTVDVEPMTVALGVVFHLV